MPQHLRSISDIPLDKTCITIGSFDGVHLGHQLLIKQFVQSSKANGCTSVVITFYPHARNVLQNNHTSFYLNSPHQRARLIGELGVDYIITMRFTKQLAAMSPQSFIDYLHSHLQFKQLWVGDDFALGKNRQGTVSILNELGKELGFSVNNIPSLIEGNQKISSSEIRNQIKEGNVQRAAFLLGYNYPVCGKVIYGDRRGRTLGIPTANLQVWKQKLLPASGVYSTWVKVKLKDTIKRFAAVTNVGIHPTFDHIAPQPQVEAHLLDFSEDIYHQFIEVEFVERIRPEMTYPSAEALISQIQSDIQFTRKLLQ